MQPQQPIQPVQPTQPTNFDFTQQPPAGPPAPVAPVAATPDPTITQLQSDITEIKTALGSLTPQTPAEVTPAPAEQPPKKYDEWGAVFEDTGKQAVAIVDARIAELQQEQTQTNDQLQAQEQQNQQYIDNIVTQLRVAGYLPPVTNQFDANDAGKQAENELLGYTISLGSTDLVSAARELKFRHDAGFKFDYQNKQFVQTQQPSNDPNAQMFGNLPATPDAQAPQNFAPIQPMGPQQPVGPQNPYMAPQYPAGFNAPVSSGNSYQGTQGGAPALRNLRANSYDALVEQFNRTN